MDLSETLHNHQDPGEDLVTSPALSHIIPLPQKVIRLIN